MCSSVVCLQLPLHVERCVTSTSRLFQHVTSSAWNVTQTSLDKHIKSEKRRPMSDRLLLLNVNKYKGISISCTHILQYLKKEVICTCTMIGIANRNDLTQFREFVLRCLLELCIQMDDKSKPYWLVSSLPYLRSLSIQIHLISSPYWKFGLYYNILNILFANNICKWEYIYICHEKITLIAKINKKTFCIYT